MLIIWKALVTYPSVFDRDCTGYTEGTELWSMIVWAPPDHSHPGTTDHLKPVTTTTPLMTTQPRFDLI